jgi:hypothetical protein
MALTTSVGTVTDGLIFSYDIDNQKSNKGPPLRNHIQTISPQTGSGTGFVLTAGSEVVDIPTLGQTNVSFSNYQNINSGGNFCCTSFMNYGNAGNIFTGSTLYTYLILYRSDSGYTHPNWMYRYEFNSSGTYLTEGGVHDNSRRTYLGNGWYYAWGTFTTQPTTAQLQYYSFTYNYSSFNDKISVAKVCILPGNYSGLHPKFWPDTNTTRSNTQALVDLTNRSTNTTNNLSYNSDGTFNFIGGDATSTITVPLSTAFNKLTGTIGMWVNPSSYSGSNGLFVNRDVNTANAVDWFWIGSWDSGSVFYFRLGNGSDCCSNDIALGSWTSFCPTNTWTYVTCSWTSAGTSRVYTNGILRGSRNISAIPATNPAATGRIGLGHESPGSWNGKIAVAQIYNRQLTDSEILSNFNSMRGRFNV